MVNDQQIGNWLVLSILAGGDTSSATLRAILYYLAKSPSSSANSPLNYRALLFLPLPPGSQSGIFLTSTLSSARQCASTPVSPWYLSALCQREDSHFWMDDISLQAQRSESILPWQTEIMASFETMRMNSIQIAGCRAKAKASSISRPGRDG